MLAHSMLDAPSIRLLRLILLGAMRFLLLGHGFDRARAAADPKSAEQALETLASRSLDCAACKYIFGSIDDSIESDDVGRMSRKSRRKWLRKAVKSKNLCAPDRFPDTMGVSQHSASWLSSVHKDALEYARRAGFGMQDKTELPRVAAGTHETLNVDSSMPHLVRSACSLWTGDEDLKAISENLDDLMMDGTPVIDFVCGDRLGVCKLRDEL
mmetsp:Transcript_37758/g.82917  ORF Transcript_37758/g.82917 Transcript_37758/m.82917 type:complete len:212 (+) Transcript_37758:42-677(+)